MDKIKQVANKLKGDQGGAGGAGADPNAPGGAPGGAPGAAGQKGDFLDQGVGMAGKQFGKDLSREDQEKYSDMARTGYTKATGSNIPIQDKNV